MAPQDLYEIYERLDAQAEASPSPVTLDDIRTALGTSPYLRSLGCRVLSDETIHAIELRNIPGVADGTVLTASRDAFDRGLSGIDGRRFASYGEPALDGILAMTAVGGLPPGSRRVAVPIPGADGAELVGYVVMRRGTNGAAAPHFIFDMRGIEEIDLDDTPMPEAAVEALGARSFNVSLENNIIYRRVVSRDINRLHRFVNNIPDAHHQ